MRSRGGLIASRITNEFPYESRPTNEGAGRSAEIENAVALAIVCHEPLCLFIPRVLFEETIFVPNLSMQCLGTIKPEGELEAIGRWYWLMSSDPST